MSIGLLQANLNHSRRAQDLFAQILLEWRCGFGIAAEPYRVSNYHPCWAVNSSGSVAINWVCMPRSPPCSKMGEGDKLGARRGRGGIPPKLGPFIRGALPCPVIAAGDYNAKSALWGSRYTWKGQGPGGLGSDTWPVSNQHRHEEHTDQPAGEVHHRSDMGFPKCGQQDQELAGGGPGVLI